MLSLPWVNWNPLALIRHCSNSPVYFLFQKFGAHLCPSFMVTCENSPKCRISSVWFPMSHFPDLFLLVLILIPHLPPHILWIFGKGVLFAFSWSLVFSPQLLLMLIVNKKIVLVPFTMFQAFAMMCVCWTILLGTFPARSWWQRYFLLVSTLAGRREMTKENNSDPSLRSTLFLEMLSYTQPSFQYLS